MYKEFQQQNKLNRRHFKICNRKLGNSIQYSLEFHINWEAFTSYNKYFILKASIPLHFLCLMCKDAYLSEKVNNAF
jgi:hypothetical protein